MERKIVRESKKDLQRKRWSESDKDIQTERYIGRKIYIEKDIQRERYVERKICREKDMQRERYVEGKMVRMAERESVVCMHGMSLSMCRGRENTEAAVLTLTSWLQRTQQLTSTPLQERESNGYFLYYYGIMHLNALQLQQPPCVVTKTPGRGVFTVCMQYRMRVWRCGCYTGQD